MTTKKHQNDGRQKLLIAFNKDKFKDENLEKIIKVIQRLDIRSIPIPFNKKNEESNVLKYALYLGKKQRKIFLNIQERGGFSSFGVISKLNQIIETLRKGNLTRSFELFYSWLEDIPKKIYTQYDLKDFGDILTYKNSEYNSYNDQFLRGTIDEERFQKSKKDIINQQIIILNQIQLVKVKIPRKNFTDKQVQLAINALKTYLNLGEVEFYLRKSPIKNYLVCEIAANKLVDFVLRLSEIEPDDYLLQFFFQLELMSGRDFEKYYEKELEKQERDRRKALRTSKNKPGTSKPSRSLNATTEDFLDFRQKGLNTVQLHWFKSENRIGIDLSNNYIVQLPSNLPFNEKLVTLDLSNNKLASIPKSIINFPNLEVLNLSNNNIKTLPKNLKELKKLKRLLLNSNRIDEIPEQIGELTQLEVLHLSNNKIKQIPSSLLKLTNLRSGKLGPFSLFGFQIGRNPIKLPISMYDKEPQEILEFLIWRQNDYKTDEIDQIIQKESAIKQKIDELYEIRARWVAELNIRKHQLDSNIPSKNKDQIQLRILILEDIIEKINDRIDSIQPNLGFGDNVVD